MTKKMISSMLAIALLAGNLTTTTYANDHINNGSQNLSEQSLVAAKLAEIWPAIARDYDVYGLSAVDVDRAVLGSEIPVYRLSDGGVVAADYSLYPVLNSSDEIAALCMAFYDDNGELGLQFQKGFADELSQAVASYGDNLALYYGGEELHILFDNSTEVYVKDLLLVSQTNYSESLDTISDIQMNNYAAKTIPISFLLNITENLNEESIEQYCLDVPEVWQNQGVMSGTNLCWAACVASIGEHFTGNSNYNVSGFTKIVSAAGLSGNVSGSYSNVAAALTKLYSVQTLTPQLSSGISYTIVKTEIDSDNPIYINLECGTSSHAVVLDGYFYNPNSTAQTKFFRLMDPWIDLSASGASSYVSVTQYSDGGFNYVLDGVKYEQAGYMKVQG